MPVSSMVISCEERLAFEEFPHLIKFGNWDV